MIKVIEDLIKEQERKIIVFKDKRDTNLEHRQGSGKYTGLTIDVQETEAVYELQGMKKVLGRCKEMSSGSL